MRKENMSAMNYLGVYLSNTGFRHRSTRNKIFVHVALKTICKTPQILNK